MSNRIINHENGDKNKIINEFPGSETSDFAAKVDGSPSESKIHLLFTRPVVHTPGAGINPIVDAAAYVFAWMGKLIQIRFQDNLQQLHFQLTKEMKEFRAALTVLNYKPEHLSEFVSIATYALCTTLDDIVEHTPWGQEGKWYPFRLLDSYEQEILSRENFLIILERFIQDQDVYIDMMEFIYICLNLGFNYHRNLSGFSVEQIQKILHSLYKRIRIYYGNGSKILSPYSFKISLTNSSQPSWMSNKQEFTRKFTNYDDEMEFLADTKPILTQEITILKNNLYKIKRYLNARSIKVKEKRINLGALPWVLVTGSIGSGKSTLLENSKIKFVIDKQTLQLDFTNAQAYNNWNWRVTPNAVLIDLPSSHISIKRNQYSFSNAHWESLLDLILHARGSAGINNVTLVVSLQEIMDKANQQILVSQLTKKIIDLQDRFGQHLALNIVISKCDLMTGFCDFFEDYTTEELFQPMGVYLSQVIKNENMLDVFYHPFDALIKRLNNQIIYRLHQERNFESLNKFRIKDFPLHMERLKENLGEIIKKVLKETHDFMLKGFYLTSATQSSFKHDESRLPKTINNHELLDSFTIMEMPEIPNRSYFIKYLLLGGLVAEPSNGATPHKVAKHNFFEFLYKLTRGI